MSDDAFEGIAPEHADRVLRGHGHAAEIARVLSRIPSDAFPLQNWKDVERALGDESFEVNVNNRKRNLRDLRKLISRDYFPVASGDDFAEKAAALDFAVSRIPHAQPATPLKAPPDGREPDRDALKAKLRIQDEQGESDG